MSYRMDMIAQGRDQMRTTDTAPQIDLSVLDAALEWWDGRVKNAWPDAIDPIVEAARRYREAVTMIGDNQ